MDFVALDNLTSSQNNTNMIPSEDLHPNPKRVGSGMGFCPQRSSVSAIATSTQEHHISNTILLQHHNMLSFSLPNTQSYNGGGQFTPSQWMELEHQALIYKYITANAAIPSNLLIPIRKALETPAYSWENFIRNTFGWGALQVTGADPEPGRCRRTDGKKWRCAKNAVVDQKYCERHINRGRHRSRKPVEAQNGAVAVVSHNSKTNMEAPMLSSPSILKRSQVSNPKEKSTDTEFGLVCSDSLLNPMHKSSAKSEHLLHQFIEDWPHSSQTARTELSATSERLDLSHVRMGLGMVKQEHRVPGGPLGEVLRQSTSK